MAFELHPGVVTAIQRLRADELGVARLMASGAIVSPQRYENITLFAIRITGTGVAYRRGLEEFVWRNPDIYLTDEFCQRCAGLPVIFEHPGRNSLDTKEFVGRIVGTVFLAYIQGSDVWAIARIYDDSAAALMSENQLSTSPAVVFRDITVNTKLTLEDGQILLIEGKPSLLDHVAVCPRGVWDKGGEPSGVSTAAIGESTMTEEERKAVEERDDRAKKDAEEKDRKDAESGEKLDKLLSHLDSLTKRMDAWETEEKGRKDAEEKERADKAKRDAEGEKSEEERKADKAKKDAEEKDEREKADKAKRDSEAEKARKDAEDIRKAVADMAARIPATLSDADYASLADAQARADSVYLAFGKQAPAPMRGETPLAYRVRLLNGVKDHSPSLKAAALDKLALTDTTVFDAVETQIYADADIVAKSPATVPEGELRCVSETMPSGHRINKYYGQPAAWMNPIAGATRQYVTKFNTNMGSAR